MNDDQALRDFVAKYARPYDPELDDYDRPRCRGHQGGEKRSDL